MVVLTGTYIYGMDRKGRVIMPGPFRQELGIPFVLTRAPGQALLALSAPQWSVLTERYEHSTLFRGYYLSAAVECGVDESTGRFLIPHALREYAELRPMEEVAVTGIGRAVQVVLRSRWDRSVHQGEFPSLGQLDLDLEMPRPAEAQPFRLRQGNPLGLPIIEARGRLDPKATRRLARALLDALGAEPPALILDLRGTGETEAALTQLLAVLQPVLAGSGTRLCLVGPPGLRDRNPARCFPDFESALWFLSEAG